MPDDLQAAEDQLYKNLAKRIKEQKAEHSCRYCARPTSIEALCQGCGAPKHGPI